MTSTSGIALVTGGSRGLGKNMALRLAEKGSDIILTYHTQKEMAESVLTEVRKMGRKAMALLYDAADVDGLDAFVKEVETLLKQHWQGKKIDFLINNAGIGATIPFAQVTIADFDRFMNIHFKSVYFLTQRMLPMMNDGGSIVNLSTGTTRFAVPGYSVYASMKGAIEVFTRYLAKELGSRGIRVNVVAPGPTETDFNNAVIRSHPERKAQLQAITALGRVGQSEDIGGVVAFLCSKDAGWVNGQRIEVTGGINL